MLKFFIKRLFTLPVIRPELREPDSSTAVPFPLDAESPWPKFRANPQQNGRSAAEPVPGEVSPWEVRTANGVFSSPVIDGEGNVYIGSGDHNFYAFSSTGRELWRFASRDIVDSSALMDDRGRIYFGSGDGHVYCLDRKTGTELWRFRAHTAAQVREEFGIETHNLDWFEGNLAILPDGTLLAPNDNYLVYALDRETGAVKRIFRSNEMGWSCPAVNGRTGGIFFGSCFFAGLNLFRCDADTGRTRWVSGGLGTVSASPLLTGESPRGAVVVGGFDGILRAFSQKNGRQIWKFGTRDHIYGSPSRLSDGTIVQASCDGTLYCLEPRRGRLRWSLDLGVSIRSSPAVDGHDQIYFGTGDGRLCCVNGDGTMRWSWQCIEGDRNDLNGSPALGPNGVVIGGENGGVFFVPYDYPLTATGRDDPRAGAAPPVEAEDGAGLLYMSRFGRTQRQLPESLSANQPVTLVHYLRIDGRTALSTLDEKSLEVSGIGDARVVVSSNRRFLSLIPRETWTGPEGGELTIRISCGVRSGLKRFGLRFFGGRVTHRIDEELRFRVEPAEGPAEMPYAAPAQVGERAAAFRFSRIACPAPTLLPSYNQIGFDSLNYLAGIVEGADDRALVWVVPGRYDESANRVVPDPELYDVYTMNLSWRRGLLTFSNYTGFAISFFGSWDMPFGLFRFAFSVDPDTGDIARSGDMNAVIRAGDIRFYGRFLKLLGLSHGREGLMPVSGGIDGELWRPDTGVDARLSGKGRIELSPREGVLTLEGSGFKKGDHVYGLLLVDAATGEAVPVNYARETSLEWGTDATLKGIRVDCGAHPLRGRYRVYLMADTEAVIRLEAEA